MEVKIGVHNAARELVLESALSADEVRKAVLDAVSAEDGILELADERGRQVIIRATHLTYVDIGAPIERRVGFATS